MRSNGPLANKKVAMGGHGWPGGLVARPFLQTGRKWPFGPPHEPSRRSDPAANAEEARTVRLDAVLGPARSKEYRVREARRIRIQLRSARPPRCGNEGYADRSRFLTGCWASFVLGRKRGKKYSGGPIPPALFQRE